MRKIYGILFFALLLGCAKVTNSGPKATLQNGTCPETHGAAQTPQNLLAISGTESNVLPITVGCAYANGPCVSVQICNPGTSTCQTIDNVLVDTGSYGLRVFKSVLDASISPVPVTDSSGKQMAECVSYLDQTSNWGAMATVDVILGQEKAPSVPIQIIDASTPSGRPSDCTNPASDPASAGYKAILGIGFFKQDCGPGCATDPNNRLYFSCASGTCTAAAAPLEKQATNPIALLPSDNNGVAIQLPGIAASGATNVKGYLVLGISTQANNTPSSSATVFPADGYGNFKTEFSCTTYDQAFIDSGSNGIFFPADSSIPQCDPNNPNGAAYGFLCPTSTMNFTAVQMGASGSSSATISFSIMNGSTALDPQTASASFDDIGGSLSKEFDWGLPFFFGRTVFVGLENQSSKLGSTVGPYWAY